MARVLVVGEEHNFGALRDRLFEGRVSAATAKAVSAALAQANPHVDLAALKPGTVLTVPDIPQIPDRGPLSLDSTVRERLDALATELTGAIAQTRDEAKPIEEEAHTERRQTLDELDEALRAAAGDQDLVAALEAARETIEREDAAADERIAALEAAAGAWAEEIEALRKLAG